jgi:phosphotransferase system  glucose/maltose/N-acetylglucosamine-specific IIC component
MHFVTTLAVPSPILAVVGLHGLTDFARGPALLPFYVASLALPPVMISPMFIVASLFHFGRDFASIPISSTYAGESTLLLHASWLAVGWLGGIDLAAAAALFYMYIFHVPLHYFRQWVIGNRRVVIWSLFVTVVAIITGLVVEPMIAVEVPEWMQRLVIAHVMTDTHK